MPELAGPDASKAHPGGGFLAHAGVQHAASQGHHCSCTPDWHLATPRLVAPVWSGGSIGKVAAGRLCLAG